MKHANVRHHLTKKIPTVLLENSRKCRHLYLLASILFYHPRKNLKSWKKQDIIAIASGDYFVETNNDYYSVNTINGALIRFTKLVVLGSL